MKKRQLNKPQSFKLVEEPAYLTRSEYMEQESMDYAKMRVGLKTVDDAIMNLGTFKKINNNFKALFYTTIYLPGLSSEIHFLDILNI